MTLYYLFKRKISQVIKPDSKWGPGDKAVRKQILEEMAGMFRNKKKSKIPKSMC